MNLDDNFGKRDSFDEYRSTAKSGESHWLIGFIGAFVLGVVLLVHAAERPSALHERKALATATSLPALSTAGTID